MIEEITAAEARVLKSPAPTVGVKAITETAVELLASPWVRTGEIGDIEPALLEAIKLRFDAEGVPLAKSLLARPR